MSGRNNHNRDAGLNQSLSNTSQLEDQLPNEPVTSSSQHEARLTEGPVVSSPSLDGSFSIDDQKRDSATSSNLHNREELLSRARGFLQSPQMQYRDVLAKRKFLAEKGLNYSDISNLLQESPQRAPVVPPRTYPQPPPSNLPNLLLGLARLFSWIGIGSAAVTSLYYRFLLPRVIQTTQARHALRSYHLSLMRRLTTSLASLKEAQSESLSALPHHDAHQEPSHFSSCTSISQLLKTLEEKDSDFLSIPSISLLRCGIADFGKGMTGDDASPTTEELFRFLEGQIPWLLTVDGLAFENQLWKSLSTCPLFTRNPPPPLTSNTTPEGDKPIKWTYHPPLTSSPSTLVKSLDELLSALPRIEQTRSSPSQHTLQALSGFTGYISTNVYLPYRSPSGGLGLGNSIGLSPAEEDFKKEIRALKGLVLNRRSFMPMIPRVESFQRPTA